MTDQMCVIIYESFSFYFLVALSSKQILCETNHSLTASVVMGRWCMSVELLSRVFVDTLGKQQYSIFSHLQSFENIERDMRREMDNLRAMVHRDLQLEVSTLYMLYMHMQH